MSVLIVLASIIAHEGGHYLVARHYGCAFSRLHFRWYGVGVGIQVPDDRLFLVSRIALGGLVTSALLMLASAAVGFWIGFAINAIILITNVLPIPRFDGWYLLRAAK